jgi:hypothetical protein
MERSLVLAQQIIASLEFNHIDFSAHRLTAERVVQTHVEALLKEGLNEDRKTDRNTLQRRSRASARNGHRLA